MNKENKKFDILVECHPLTPSLRPLKYIVNSISYDEAMENMKGLMDNKVKAVTFTISDIKEN